MAKKSFKFFTPRPKPKKTSSAFTKKERIKMRNVSYKKYNRQGR